MVLDAIGPSGFWLAACLGIGAPLAFTRGREPAPPLSDRLARGLLGGLALSGLMLTYFLDPIGEPLFRWLPGLGLTGWAAFLLHLSWRRGRDLGWPSLGGLAVSGLLLATFAATLIRTDLPWGYDPVFHTILSDSILSTHRITATWEPHEPIPVNYPQALHALVALVAERTDRPLPVVFQAFYLWGGLLEAGIFALAARRFLPGASAVIAAVLAHEFCARFGSFFSYVTWGGMPTLFASALLLGVVAELHGSSGWRGSGARCGLYLVGLAAMHHLMAIVAGVVVLVAAIDGLADRSRRDALRALALALACSVVLAGPLLAWYLGRSSGLSQTHTLTFRDEPQYRPTLAARGLGWPLLVLLLGGWLTGLRRSSGVRHVRFLLGWAGALLLVFVALDYGYRAYAERVHGESYTAFTPSRFLTAATLPLAILAARIVAGTEPARRTARALLPWAAVIGCSLWGAWLHVQAIRVEPTVGYSEVEPFLWVRAAAPVDAFLLYGLPESTPGLRWAPALTGREGFQSPIPASELRDDPWIVRKNGVQGSIPQDPQLRSLRSWLSGRRKTGYLVVRRSAVAGRTPRGFEPFAERGQWLLLRLSTGESP